MQKVISIAPNINHYWQNPKGKNSSIPNCEGIFMVSFNYLSSLS